MIHFLCLVDIDIDMIWTNQADLTDVQQRKSPSEDDSIDSRTHSYLRLYFNGKTTTATSLSSNLNEREMYEQASDVSLPSRIFSLSSCLSIRMRKRSIHRFDCLANKLNKQQWSNLVKRIFNISETTFSYHIDDACSNVLSRLRSHSIRSTDMGMFADIELNLPRYLFAKRSFSFHRLTWCDSSSACRRHWSE